MQRRILPILVSALGLALAAGCATGSSGPTAATPWNQAAVTGLARQLSTAADAWQLALRQQDPAQLGSGTSQEGLRLIQKAQVVSEHARALAGHLDAGEGREQTLDTFRSLKEITDDAQQDQARTITDKPTLAAWSKFTGLLRQVQPYYEK